MILPIFYAGGGASRVGSSGTVKDHWYVDASQLQNIAVPKNGYIFVYVSNESNLNVFFDNVQVIHKPGPILEETHYYPFGLSMAGISSKAAGTLENKRKWNKGSELQSKEFSDGSGLELYSTFYRSLDPQLGRFWQIDPKPDYSQSLYSSMNNNPISINDPLGDTAIVRWRSGFLGLRRREARYVDGAWIDSKNRKAINMNKVSSQDAKSKMNDYTGLNNNTQFDKLTNKINTSGTNVVFTRAERGATDPGNNFRDKKTNELIVNLPSSEKIRDVLNNGNASVTLNSQQVMGHELSHVYDKLNGNFAGSYYSISAQGIYHMVSDTEKDAMYYENILRSQGGLPLRILYDAPEGRIKVNNANALINYDANGNPIGISNLVGETYNVR